MLAVAVSCLNLATSAAEATGRPDLVAHLIATVFDPSWNVAHRTTIWAIIVIVLFLSGVGLPLPEDIPLTLAGFTTIKQAQDVFVFSHFVATFVAVVVPILLGDMIAYAMGRRYGIELRERIRPLRRLITDKRLERVQRWFDSYGSFTVFLGRQVAGVRFVTFFTAGSMRVRLGRFVFYDFLGCVVSVPIWLGLGVLASRYGEEWLHAAARKVGSGFVLGAILVFVAFVVAVKLRGGTTRARAIPKPVVKITERAD